jgi:hypothetical protein
LNPNIHFYFMPASLKSPQLPHPEGLTTMTLVGVPLSDSTSCMLHYVVVKTCVDLFFSDLITKLPTLSSLTPSQPPIPINTISTTSQSESTSRTFFYSHAQTYFFYLFILYFIC